ncbi:MAG TPA: PEP-CTERM sorting domain-containing protein, partial [Kiritimatiellia bacterium]|nr:PEP-CTERM sorting domain-containing protein [Kiritimatiellia bacterium]
GDGRIIAGGNSVHALAEGTSIGPDTPQEDWLQGYLGQLNINSSATVPPGVVVNTGEFLLITAYMGVMFNIEDAVHYGWVRISNPFNGTGGTIMDFAYETEPGVGIFAGAGTIPEPATAALLTVGGLLLALRRKRK